MYQSYFIESFKEDLDKVIKKISDLFQKKGISFCVIGGASRFKYGVSKITEDIDILVADEDKGKVKDISIGYMKDRSHGRAKVFSFHDPKAKLEIIYSGEISGDGVHGLKYVDPVKISKKIDGVPYISLKSLIQYKLSSGIYGNRMKDFVDIIELIQANNLKRDYAKNFRSDLIDKYVELWDSIKNIKSI